MNNGNEVKSNDKQFITIGGPVIDLNDKLLSQMLSSSTQDTT